MIDLIIGAKGRQYTLSEIQNENRVFYWLSNEAEEGMVITETQLFNILDGYFRKNL